MISIIAIASHGDAPDTIDLVRSAEARRSRRFKACLQRGKGAARAKSFTQGGPWSGRKSPRPMGASGSAVNGAPRRLAEAPV